MIACCQAKISLIRLDHFRFYFNSSREGREREREEGGERDGEREMERERDGESELVRRRVSAASPTIPVCNIRPASQLKLPPSHLSSESNDLDGDRPADLEVKSRRWRRWVGGSRGIVLQRPTAMIIFPVPIIRMRFVFSVSHIPDELVASGADCAMQDDNLNLGGRWSLCSTHITLGQSAPNFSL